MQNRYIPLYICLLTFCSSFTMKNAQEFYEQQKSNAQCLVKNLDLGFVELEEKPLREVLFFGDQQTEQGRAFVEQTPLYLMNVEDGIMKFRSVTQQQLHGNFTTSVTILKYDPTNQTLETEPENSAQNGISVDVTSHKYAFYSIDTHINSYDGALTRRCDDKTLHLYLLDTLTHCKAKVTNTKTYAAYFSCDNSSLITCQEKESSHHKRVCLESALKLKKIKDLFDAIRSVTSPHQALLVKTLIDHKHACDKKNKIHPYDLYDDKEREGHPFSQETFNQLPQPLKLLFEKYVDSSPKCITDSHGTTYHLSKLSQEHHKFSIDKKGRPRINDCLLGAKNPTKVISRFQNKSIFLETIDETEVKISYKSDEGKRGEIFVNTLLISQPIKNSTKRVLATTTKSPLQQYKNDNSNTEDLFEL